jgi:hypothetical protein
MGSQKTAVEWLVDELKDSGIFLMKDELEMIEQANKMFEQQIINAFEQGEYTGRGFEDLTSEEYYDINF